MRERIMGLCLPPGYSDAVHHRYIRYRLGKESGVRMKRFSKSIIRYEFEGTVSIHNSFFFFFKTMRHDSWITNNAFPALHYYSFHWTSMLFHMQSVCAYRPSWLCLIKSNLPATISNVLQDFGAL